MTYLLVALGGAMGATLRYAIGMAVVFPFGTLLVNIIGSFAIGIAFVAFDHSTRAHPFVLTGLLGGFTTFSAFSLDTLKLIEAGRIASAGLYAGASLGASVLAVFAGVMLARGMWP